VVEPEPVGLMVDPLGEVLGPTVLPDGFMALLAPLLADEPVVPVADGAAPVVLALVLLGLAAEAPPVPPAPLACAKASVELRARADASAMVANFMRGSPGLNQSNDRHRPIVPVARFTASAERRRLGSKG
jgi:hypothetical protein